MKEFISIKDEMNKIDNEKDVEAKMEAETPKVEAVENTAEDPFAKGRERMEAISQTISSAKEKVSSLASSVGGSISRFWSKAKSFGSEAVVATLSADVIAEKGLGVLENKSVEVGQAVKQGFENVKGGVEDKLNAFGDKAVEAGEWTKEKADETVDLAKQGFEYSKDKVVGAGEWIGDQASEIGNLAVTAGEDVSEFAKKNYEKASEFVGDKAEKLKEFKDDSVELAKDVSFFVAEKSGAALEKAKDGVANKYNKVKAFGENAILSAKIEAGKKKEKFKEDMNNLHLRRIEAEIAKANEKAEKLRYKREGLLEKMGLLDNLKMAA